MELPEIRSRALAVLADLEQVRCLTHEDSGLREKLWEKIVREMKEFPKAPPGLRHVYSSSLKRAARTAELAAITAHNLPPIRQTQAIKEIELGKEFDDELVKRSEEILTTARHKEEALERLKALYRERGYSEPMEDTLENRGQLANPEAAFEGGDTTRGYAARVIKGYVGILSHGCVGETREIEAIVAGLPEPSEAFIRHVFAVQRILQLPPAERGPMFDEKFVYEPLIEVCRRLAGHRVALARHGETSFSKQKILTGGHIDVDLIDEGADAAVETGILLKLYNKCYPNNVRIIQIYGHSAASAIVEAALCACCLVADDRTNGQYRVGEPHEFDFDMQGGLVVRAVSRQSLSAWLLEEGGMRKGLFHPWLGCVREWVGNARRCKR